MTSPPLKRDDDLFYLINIYMYLFLPYMKQIFIHLTTQNLLFYLISMHLILVNVYFLIGY